MTQVCAMCKEAVAELCPNCLRPAIAFTRPSWRLKLASVLLGLKMARIVSGVELFYCGANDCPAVFFAGGASGGVRHGLCAKCLEPMKKEALSR